MPNAYAEGEQYANQLSAELPYTTSCLPKITASANELLRRIYRPNYKYRKVMICLTGLSNDTNPQLDLFDEIPDHAKKFNPLMQAFDQINNRYGRCTIKLAYGLSSHKPDKTALYMLRMDHLSPCYTTKIAEIPFAH